MKKLRFLCALLLAGVCVSALFSQTDKTAVKVAALNGPSGIGMAYLFENRPELNGSKATFEVFATPDVLLPKLISGEIDISILPPNVAAKVYNSANGALLMGGIVGTGMLSVITKDPSVTSLRDLKGKTVSVAGQGSTPEFLFKYLIEKEGLKPSDITFDFSLLAPDITAALVSGKIAYALVPEPFATIAVQRDSSVRRAIDLQKLWAAVPGNAATYPITVVVIRKEFAQQYPDTTRQFLDAYRKAIDWTNANPKEAGDLVEKHTLGLKANIVAASIPVCGLTFVDASSARLATEQFFSVFLNFAPKSIGGKLPDSGFYFK